MISTSYLLLAITTLMTFVHKCHGGAMTDSINSLTPETCRDSCAAWTNSTAPCVEGTGSLGGNYDPVSGTFTFDGNKIAIYFCVCSTDAIAKSEACLNCLSGKYCFTPPLTLDTYKGICNGQGSLSSLMSLKATC